MKGVSLQGEAMCSHGSYDIVMKVVEQNTLSYLSPSKFASRQSELRLEKPKKTLEISSGSVRVADQRDDHTCAVQAPLDLHWAFMRRSLACDLVGLASFDAQQTWHSYLMKHLSADQPPAGYQKVTVSQVLCADQAAWLRMSELTPDGIQRRADGSLPLDSLFTQVMSDPKVMFHLLPLPAGANASAPKRPLDDAADPPPSGGGKRPKSKGKDGKGNSKQRTAPRNMPTELQGMNATTRAGNPICFNYNLKCGCDKAAPGKKCPRGLHICCHPNCGKTHSLQQHGTAAA